MASTYPDDPQAAAFQATVSQLRAMTQSAVGLAQAQTAAGGDYATIIAALSDTVEPVFLEVMSLEVTGIPSELLDYREAWSGLANEIWAFG